MSFRCVEHGGKIKVRGNFMREFLIRVFLSIMLFGCSERACDHASKLEHEDTLRKTKPIAFLNSLRKSNSYKKDEYVEINPASQNWVSKNDVKELLTYLDSNIIRAFSVYSSAPSMYSFTVGRHGCSTLAREAYYLIESYRYNSQYPPYCTIPTTSGPNEIHYLSDSLISETRAWWNEENK